MGGILRTATSARWPMYLRNVKQLLRAASFDERSYGFGGLMDLLRACQREGLMQVERDRRRGMRIFQGAALGAVGVPRAQAAAHTDTQPVESMSAAAADFPASRESALEDADADNVGNVIDVRNVIDMTDIADREPTTVVDTTAELLGRAKARRPRARSAAAAAAPRRVTKKATAAPVRRTSRPRRPKEE